MRHPVTVLLLAFIVANELRAISCACDTSKLFVMAYNKKTKSQVKLTMNDMSYTKSSDFEKNKTCVAIFHGVGSSATGEFPEELRKRIDNIDGTVITLAPDFSGCKTLLYNDHVADVPNKAACYDKIISDFISYYSIEKLIVMGHSMGAHIGATMCARMKSRGMEVDTMMGFDAAGPGFNNGENADRQMKSGVAKKTICIHSSDSFGMSNNCGDCNIYLNGGSEQPDCKSAMIPAGCNHFGASRTYNKMMDNNIGYPAYKCKSARDAQNPQTAPTTCKYEGVCYKSYPLIDMPAGDFFVSTVGGQC